MKKKILKAIAMCVALVTVVSCFVVSSAAAIVPGRFYNTDAQSTATTGTYGYSSGNFTGEYYSAGSTDNRALMTGECRGGSVSSFTTDLYMRLSNSTTSYGWFNKDSDDTGSRLISNTFTVNSNNMSGSVVGIIEAKCRSKTYSPDWWFYTYDYAWSGASVGWVEWP
jgi:hypothetical protein